MTSIDTGPETDVSIEVETRVTPSGRFAEFGQRISSDNRVLLGGILLLGVVLRLYRFGGSIADSYAFRQMQTASTVWLWQRDGFDFFHYHVPMFGNGFWVLELPTYQFIVVVMSRPFGFHEEFGRVVNIASYVVAAILIYAIGKRFLGATQPALLAAFLFSIVPINVFYFRAFLIDPFHIALTLFALFSLIRLHEKFSWLWFVGFAITLIFAALGKATLVAAVGLAMAALTMRILLGPASLFRKVALVSVWLTVAVLNFTWTRFADSLNEPSNGMTFKNMRWWLFGSTFTDWDLWTIIGTRTFDQLQLPGILLVAIGVASIPSLRSGYRLEMAGLMLSAFLTIGIFANLNRVHDYYQLPYYIGLSLLGGLGLWTLSNSLSDRGPTGKGRPILAGLLITITAMWTLNLFNTFYHPQAIAIAYALDGVAVRANTPDEPLLVSAPGADPNEPMLFYEARRVGWRVALENPAAIRARLEESPEIGAVVFTAAPEQITPEARAEAEAAGFTETFASARVTVYS